MALRTAAVWLLIVSCIERGLSAPQALDTPWTSSVSDSNALTEYPRPQLKRGNWQNLNGVWQFADGGDYDSPPFTDDLSGTTIRVPFPVESRLSGINAHHASMWYKRTFTLPSAWNGQRILLHFGAADWMTTVWVNQAFQGTHRGGYDNFYYDITAAVVAGGYSLQHTIVVSVVDPTDTEAGNPVGKQSLASGGVYYTPTSGIWRTVWLEPVPKTFVTGVDVVADIDNQQINVTISGNKEAAGLPVVAVVRDNNASIAVGNGTVGVPFTMPIPAPKLWSPSSPHLYGLLAQINDTYGDTLEAYFGMRKVSVAKDAAGRPRLMLNNRFVFMSAVMAQGWWPDGQYTAPTDEALIFDIQKAKDLGFNTIRLHQKVEPDRFYYHADRLGMLLWQDMPCICGPTPNTPLPLGRRCAVQNPFNSTDKAQFREELKQLIMQHKPFPSVVAYAIFNEAWGQFDTKQNVQLAIDLDPTRLMDPASGFNDSDIGQVIDTHNYDPQPFIEPATETRASALMETGGIGLVPSDSHIYDQSVIPFWFHKANSTGQMTTLSAALYNDPLPKAMLDNKTALSAACFTQLYDVEMELDGIITYDRQRIKLDVGTFHDANQRLVNASSKVPFPGGNGTASA